MVNPQQNPRESRPAGMWRDFVRGLRASISASTSRLNAIAADRAPTMAITIQSTIQPLCGRGKAAFAKRQQRAGQREGQREHRVLEADHFERQSRRFRNASVYRGAMLRTMTEDQLRALLEDVQSGATGVDDALERVRHLPFEDLGFAKVDHHRALRHGMPEVVFGLGKTTPVSCRDRGRCWNARKTS
jgi:hypothetical protein